MNKKILVTLFATMAMISQESLSHPDHDDDSANTYQQTPVSTQKTTESVEGKPVATEVLESTEKLVTTTSKDALSSTSQAANNEVLKAKIDLNTANNLIKSASNNFIEAEKVFPGPDGLTGVVMKSPSGKGIAWIPDTGKNIIIGVVMNEHGKNLSIAAHDTHIGKADNKPVERNSALLGALDQLKGVTIGNDRAIKTLYVFGDLNCHFCEEFYRIASKSMDLKVKWLPVAVLGAKSLNQATTLLSLNGNQNQRLALDNHHGSLNQSLAESTAEHDSNMTVYRDQVNENTELFSKLGNGTPLLAFWNGHEVELVPGAPTKEQFNQIAKKIKTSTQTSKKAKK